MQAQKADLSDEKNIQQVLADGTDEARQETLKEIGVDADSAEKYASMRLSMAGGPTWQHLREYSIPTAVLFLPCTGEDVSGLYLLQKVQDKWQVVDVDGFDCHYSDDVSIDIASLRERNIDDILVHNDCEEHGTGYVEHYYRVFSIENGKLKKEFEAKDKLYVDGWPKEDSRDQKSLVIPIPTKTAPHQDMEETKITILNGQRTVLRRYIYWSSVKRKFLTTKFMNVAGAN